MSNESRALTKYSVNNNKNNNTYIDINIYMEEY